MRIWMMLLAWMTTGRVPSRCSQQVWSVEENDQDRRQTEQDKKEERQETEQVPMEESNRDCQEEGWLRCALLNGSA